jgi:hypothetical protein
MGLLQSGGLISNGVKSQPQGRGFGETLTFRFVRCYRDYHSLVNFLITDYGKKGKFFDSKPVSTYNGIP